MLSPRASRLRDWALFAAAASVPAICVGVLGLRALANEADGARREVALGLATASARLSRAIDQETDIAAAALAALPADSVAPDAAAAALAGIAPPFAAPVLLAPDRSVLLPPQAALPPAPAPAGCAALARAAAGPDAEGRAGARRDFLARCAEARSPAGRWLWPVLALDTAADRADAAADRAVDEAAIAAWLEAHAAGLSEAERKAAALEADAALSGEPRERARAALAAPRPERDALVAELQRGGLDAALRARPDGRGLVSWRTGASAGTLRALPDGRSAGFVIHAGSLAGWLRGDARPVPPDVRADVLAGPAAAGAAGRAPVAPELGGAPAALLPIAPELAVRLSPADPAAVARHAARGKRVLVGVGAAATALALGLAALLFARMRAARRSSELRTDFVAAVSHELRTPIASVRMLSELLEEGRLAPEEHREVFEALGRESRRLGETVERLLGFSRMMAGRAAAQRAPARVAAAVAASIDTFEERNPEMPRVERDLDQTAEASIDAGQIQLAVDNLLANALKYAPRAAPYRVRVARERGGVAIAVEDRGPGIARRDQRRIFEPFERADDRLSRAVSGSGIGLSLVRHVARAHGGSARVASEPGRGAAFTLWIPGPPGATGPKEPTGPMGPMGPTEPTEKTP
ncbi:HAMP domain-containing sensor histidine kinase [Sorangium sp. So ce291]|uniref:sensor histidine kinase n=1 Tax=Sorangium sp. So ce291 TaxID=3133294 RepID=UPI003F6454BB